jgi:hypothetical protein
VCVCVWFFLWFSVFLCVSLCVVFLFCGFLTSASGSGLSLLCFFPGGVCLCVSLFGFLCVCVFVGVGVYCLLGVCVSACGCVFVGTVKRYMANLFEL